MSEAPPRALLARVAPVAPAVVITATFVHGLHYSWLRWGDLITDCGRELEVARQIADGQMLYVDVRWFYGPLAPYVNGILFALLGVHTAVLMAAGAVSAAIMALVLYALARRLTGRLAATIAATAFLCLCAFGHYYFNGIFNWVLPYTYAATYGMLAATTSLYLLVRHVQDGRARDLRLSVACLALASLAKVEAFVPAAAAHLVFIAATRPPFRTYVTYVVGGAATLGVVCVFWLRLGSQLLDDYRAVVYGSAVNPIIARHMGLGDWTGALERVWPSGWALVYVLSLAWGASLLLRVRSLSAWGRWGIVALSFVVAAFVFWRVRALDQLRILPLPLATLLIVWAVRWWRGAARNVVLPHVLVLVFALTCLVRVPLTTGAFHYGFYLLPVPLLAFIVAWFRDLPDWLPGRPVALVSAMGAGLFAAVLVRHYDASMALYAKHRTLVETPRGRMYILDDFLGSPVGRAQAETVQLLSRYPSATRVLVIPMGIGLTFLSGLTSVCGMQSFTPPELAGPFEDRLLACLEAAPPDLVVTVRVGLGEFGVRTFGDYARKVSAWIPAHYDPLASFGPDGYVHVYVLRGRS